MTFSIGDICHTQTCFFFLWGSLLCGDYPMCRHFPNRRCVGLQDLTMYTQIVHSTFQLWYPKMFLIYPLCHFVFVKLPQCTVMAIYQL